MSEEKLNQNNCGDETCPHCEKRKAEEKESENASFAVLLSLIPLLVLTFFSQIGIL